MLYVFMLMDKPGSGELRQANRPVHKAYLAEMQERIAFAGPLLADDGTTMVGSLLVIDFLSRDAAEAWLAQEPFVQAGVFASTTVQAFVNLWPQKVGFPA
ncbi:YciI family protein [Aquabacterium sp.]|uniref:YciI family protein n=1 Tax=Aquabacterium sp. TaxID=1872578 RepID=UPI003BAFF6A4